MKKLALSGLATILLISSPIALAQVVIEKVQEQAPLDVVWSLNSATPEVSIQNGGGSPLTITINVDQGGGGISIKNCGTTTSVKAGSSTVCVTNDPVNVVTFVADSPGKTSTGSYRIAHGIKVQ